MQTAALVRPLPLKDQVYLTIRDKLRLGELGADERLVDKTIASDMNISRTPVREALQILTHEGLLEATSRGFKLGKLSQREVADLYELRLLLEPKIAYKAAQSNDTAQARALSEYVKTARSASTSDQLDVFNAAVYGFFEQLLAMCGNHAMVSSVQLYHDRLAQLRVSIMASSSNRKLATRGFSAVAKAVRAKDRDAAKEAAIQHIQSGINACKALGLIAPDELSDE